MPTYTPPLRDMQFLIHEVLKATDELKACPKHADVDADTINAVLEEGGKFAAEVTFPLNVAGDEEGCTPGRTRSRRPGASRTPTPSTWKVAGRRCRATRSSAARACPSS
jgi:hypothetical protein